MTPGTVPCVVSEGHDTAGLSPVSWRENAKVRYGNLAFGENLHALRLENAPLRGSLSGNTPSHSRRPSPRYTRRCRLLALGFPRLKQYSIVLASSLRAGYANRGRALCARNTRTHGNLAFGENLRALRLENAPLRGSLSGNTPSHSRRPSPRYTRRCRLLALGFPLLKQYSIVLASSLRAANANPIVRSAHEMGSRRVSKKRME